MWCELNPAYPNCINPNYYPIVLNFAVGLVDLFFCCLPVEMDGLLVEIFFYKETINRLLVIVKFWNLIENPFSIIEISFSVNFGQTGLFSLRLSVPVYLSHVIQSVNQSIYQSAPLPLCFSLSVDSHSIMTGARRKRVAAI